MSDPHDLDSVPPGGGRLVDEGADDFERALLRSAKRDRMHPDQKRVLATALGVGAGGATVLGATKAAAAAKSGAKLGTLALVKWLGIGLATVAATAGTARLVVERQAVESPEPTLATSAPTSAQPGPMVPRKSAAEPVGAPPAATATAAEVEAPPTIATQTVAHRDALPASPRRSDPTAVAPGVPTSAPVPAAAATTVSPIATVTPITSAAAPPSLPAPAESSAPRAVAASYLDEQLALIGKARAALDAHDAAGAAQILDTYGARFPRGALMEEAELLRVRAAAQRGDRSRARALADVFLARHPGSPYAASVRALVEEK